MNIKKGKTTVSASSSLLGFFFKEGGDNKPILRPIQVYQKFHYHFSFPLLSATLLLHVLMYRWGGTRPHFTQKPLNVKIKKKTGIGTVSLVQTKAGKKCADREGKSLIVQEDSTRDKTYVQACGAQKNWLSISCHDCLLASSSYAFPVPFCT